MRIIDKKTGIDILECNDVNKLRDIILDHMIDTPKIMEQYGFFLLKCYREKIPLINATDWLNLKK